MKNVQRYVITGVLTIIPIWFTWLVFDFIFTHITNFWKPWVEAMSGATRVNYPLLAQMLTTAWLQTIVALILTIFVLYALGWLTSRVIGKRLLALFDNTINRIPVVQTIYGAVKKLIVALSNKPENLQRVVLINFPSPEMKTVGFVTHVFQDAKTKEEIAAVYVPTTPNPTSGYMELVAVSKLIMTDWTMDEAMTFVLSAGSVAPASFPSLQSD